MIIFGAGGFAKELLQVYLDLNFSDNIFFYDDINLNKPNYIYEKFKVLNKIDQVVDLFERQNKDYVLGIGNPKLRQNAKFKFDQIGGNLKGLISPFTNIGKFDVKIGLGTNILSNVTISNSASIGQNCILYYGVKVTHDCAVGDFVDLSPDVVVLGASSIGNFTQIGANSTILPKVKIGNNVIIGSGSVVTKDIPDNSIAFGVPARVVKANI